MCDIEIYYELNPRGERSYGWHCLRCQMGGQWFELEAEAIEDFDAAHKDRGRL